MKTNIVEYAEEHGYIKISEDKLFITKKGMDELNVALNVLFEFELIVNSKLEQNQDNYNNFYESFSQEGLYRILLDHLETKRERTDYELMLNGMLSFL